MIFVALFVILVPRLASLLMEKENTSGSKSRPKPVGKLWGTNKANSENPRNDHLRTNDDGDYFDSCDDVVGGGCWI